MRIEPISHRGFWLERDERNTELAFRRSLDAGFGIETDLRDRNGQVVIAHDIDDPGSMTFEAFLALYRSYHSQPMLALNIKADGLQAAVKALLQRYAVDRYFVFDMSVPDLLGYRAAGIRYYSRVSEYEETATCLEEADGVWLDQFQGDWVDERAVETFTRSGKHVCIVSPELHRRDPAQAWSKYRKLSRVGGDAPVYLCTDEPLKAREYFA